MIDLSTMEMNTGYTPTEAQMLEAWVDHADPHRKDVDAAVEQFELFLTAVRADDGTDTSRIPADPA